MLVLPAVRSRASTLLDEELKKAKSGAEAQRPGPAAGGLEVEAASGADGGPPPRSWSFADFATPDASPLPVASGPAFGNGSVSASLLKEGQARLEQHPAGSTAGSGSPAKILQAVVSRTRSFREEERQKAGALEKVIDLDGSQAGDTSPMSPPTKSSAADFSCSPSLLTMTVKNTFVELQTPSAGLSVRARGGSQSCQARFDEGHLHFSLDAVPKPEVETLAEEADVDLAEASRELPGEESGRGRGRQSWSFMDVETPEASPLARAFANSLAPGGVSILSFHAAHPELQPRLEGQPSGPLDRLPERISPVAQECGGGSVLGSDSSQVDPAASSGLSSWGLSPAAVAAPRGTEAPSHLHLQVNSAPQYAEAVHSLSPMVVAPSSAAPCPLAFGGQGPRAGMPPVAPPSYAAPSVFQDSSPQQLRDPQFDAFDAHLQPQHLHLPSHLRPQPGPSHQPQPQQQLQRLPQPHPQPQPQLQLPPHLQPPPPPGHGGQGGQGGQGQQPWQEAQEPCSRPPPQPLLLPIGRDGGAFRPERRSPASLAAPAAQPLVPGLQASTSPPAAGRAERSRMTGALPPSRWHEVYVQGEGPGGSSPETTPQGGRQRQAQHRAAPGQLAELGADGAHFGGSSPSGASPPSAGTTPKGRGTPKGRAPKQAPRGFCPSGATTSVGSMGHGELDEEGQPKCQPCAWFFKDTGCLNGANCRYCHFCPHTELKTRKKDKIQRLRAQEAAELAAAELAGRSPAAAQAPPPEVDRFA